MSRYYEICFTNFEDHWIWFPALFILGWLLLDYFCILSPRKIKGLPLVRGYPIVGNLFQVLSNPAQQYTKWAEAYGDVYQIRLGTQMVVVANSYESVRDLWIRRRDANNSRPVLHTFHKVVSKTQGFTIGTTPYGDSFKRMKKIVATSLNRQKVDDMSQLISDECTNMLKRIEIERRSTRGHARSPDLDLFKLLQGYVLRISLYITYGYLVKVEHTDKCKLFDEITEVENAIVRLRGHTSNLEDYLPILRIGPLGRKNSMAKNFKVRRDVYMKKFIDELNVKLKNGEDFQNSIVSKALRKCPEYPEVNDNELKSICLTMVSAGLDNTPLVLDHILGHLSQPITGRFFQDMAISEILKQYGDLETAFHICGFEKKVDYIEALLKEGLRYFSVLPTSLPRATSKDIQYRGAFIPKGTIMFMNTFSANHDSDHFDNPYVFNPSRYLDENYKMKVMEEGTTMLTFGAGSRMCAGAHLAMKEMYVALTRILILYKIFPPTKKYLMELDPFKLNSIPDSVAIEPCLFKVTLEERDPEVFHRIISVDP